LALWPDEDDGEDKGGPAVEVIMTTRLGLFLQRMEGQKRFWKMIMYFDTMLQYYLGIDKPEELSANNWAMKLVVMQIIRKDEAKIKSLTYAGL